MALFNYDLFNVKPESVLPSEKEREAYKQLKADKQKQSVKGNENKQEQFGQIFDLTDQQKNSANNDNADWKEQWYSYKGEDAPDWFTQAKEQIANGQPSSVSFSYKKSEPVSAPEVKAEDLKPKEATTSSIKYTPYQYEDDGVRGNPNYKYDVNALQDEAYKQVMDDYHAEQKNVEKQRAYIDKAMAFDDRINDRRENALQFFEDRFNNTAKQQEAESQSDWTDWLNPMGILKAPVRLFAGQEVYNPKSGQYERRMPTNWDDLSWNLLRNVGTLASGVQYTGGSGGRGGISFGYNNAMPLALMDRQRENAHRPFADWEEIQRNFANDAREGSLKSWTINNPYPKAHNPFEENMRKRVADEMAFEDAIAQKNRLMEYLNIQKGTPEEVMLDKDIFGRTKKLGADLYAYQKMLDDTGLYSDEDKKELSKMYLAHAWGLDSFADKQSANALKREEMKLKYESEAEEHMLKARELYLKGMSTEAEIEYKKAMSVLALARAAGEEKKASGKGESNLPTIADLNAGLLNDGNQWFEYKQGNFRAKTNQPTKKGEQAVPLLTREEAKEWLERFNELLTLAATQDKGVNFGSIGFQDKMNPDFSRIVGLTNIRKGILNLYPDLETSETSGEQKKNNSVNPPASEPMANSDEAANNTPPQSEPMEDMEDEDYVGEDGLTKGERELLYDEQTNQQEPDEEEQDDYQTARDKSWVDWATRLWEAENKLAKGYQSISDNQKVAGDWKTYWTNPKKYWQASIDANNNKDVKEARAEIKALENDLTEQVKADDKRVGELARELAKENGDVKEWANDLPRWYKSLGNTRYRIVSVVFEPVAEKIINYENKHEGEKPSPNMVERWIFNSLSGLAQPYQKAIQHGTFTETDTYPLSGRSLPYQYYEKPGFDYSNGIQMPNAYEINRDIVLDFLKAKGIY